MNLFSRITVGIHVKQIIFCEGKDFVSAHECQHKLAER